MAEKERTLREVDRALGEIEKTAKDKNRDSLTEVRSSRTLIQELTQTIAKNSETHIRGLTETYAKESFTKIDGLATTRVGEAKTWADLSETRVKEAKTWNTNTETRVNDVSRTYAHWTRTYTDHSHSVSWLTTGFTMLAASLTAVTVGISLFKIDEKGITLLGATKEWGGPLGRWWKGRLQAVERRWASKQQKEERIRTEREIAATNSLLQHYIDQLRDLSQKNWSKTLDHYHQQFVALEKKNWAREVNKIAGASAALRGARDNTRNELSRNLANRVGQGIASPVPDSRGVISDVRILHSTLDRLIGVLA
ncbi:hypothetical protein [Streptomyces sp. NPDC059076]|uniref:hypothetical protein n=1 Tax=unclassified Streptomyces TaxID=2593676 RepID=UPI0036AFFDE4